MQNVDQDSGPLAIRCGSLRRTIMIYLVERGVVGAADVVT